MKLENQKIAIIGLGRIGSIFLRNMLTRRERGVHVTAVAETDATPGRQQALDAGVSVLPLDQIVAMGESIDVLFDLTGNPVVRRDIRVKLMEQGNHHTVVASETIARLMWAMTTEDELPVTAGRSTGY